ncbi:MAG: DEAD/DEAH box helicase [Sphingopyxis sp.]
MPFSSVSPLLAEALSARGYSTATPVQASVIVPEAAGRDLIVSAQTGSGKTVAFGLAMAEQLIEGDTCPYSLQPLALVIAPTRELALQVSRELMWLYGKARARIVTCVGGMDASRERRNLASGAHIVVGTPGRLRDHLERGALDLSAVRVAVLDEADEMLDMGFREDLEQILDGTPSERRTLLFSATMPKSIVSLAKRYQRDALRISTVGEDRGHGDISYQAVTVAPADIENSVVNLLRYHEAESALLFCATRDNVRHLHASLVERGFSVVALSGEHSQNERNHALQSLRDRRARICVATDVAARGIDLPTLSLVIHVELPRDPEALQHRSGRTGRAGKKGTAILLVPYQRRRRVEMLLRDARIEAEWKNAPTAADIRRKDRTRLIETLTQPVEADEEDLAIVRHIQEVMSADDIAAALVQAHRAKMPVAEDIIDVSVRPERSSVRREGFDDTVWFRINIGRRQNADPRWILPLLCRRGHITKNEIGAIKISTHETLFDVPRAIADRFAEALLRTANPDADDGVVIAPFGGDPNTPASNANRAPRHGGPREPRRDHGNEPRREAKRDYAPDHSQERGPEPRRELSARPHTPGGKPGGNFAGKAAGKAAPRRPSPSRPMREQGKPYRGPPKGRK